jgi:hypothetical protein
MVSAFTYKVNSAVHRAEIAYPLVEPRIYSPEFLMLLGAQTRLLEPPWETDYDLHAFKAFSSRLRPYPLRTYQGYLDCLNAREVDCSRSKASRQIVKFTYLVKPDKRIPKSLYLKGRKFHGYKGFMPGLLDFLPLRQLNLVVRLIVSGAVKSLNALHMHPGVLLKRYKNALSRF